MNSNIIQPIKSFEQLIEEELSKLVKNKTKVEELKKMLVALVEEKKLVRAVAKEDLANEILSNFGHAVLVRVSNLEEVNELKFEPATVSNVVAFNKAEIEEKRQQQIKDIFGKYITE